MSLTAELARRKLVRLRARPDLQLTPQKYEGKTHIVVKDPVSLKYYRFNDQEYYVFGKFDGRHTLEQIQKGFEREFRPHRLTLEDLEAFAQQLLTAGLVQHETPLAGKELFDKQRKQRRLQKFANFTNILYIKVPLVDPDRLLTWMLKYTGWIFTRTFFFLSVLLMLSAVLQVATHWSTFYARLPAYHEFFRWNTLLYLWIALGVVKVIHEFGHGLSCKAYGGECHEMGFLLLCLSPCLYCNVSDSWTIPDKWKRITISFAGIYVELVIAAIATWIWWWSTDPIIQHISLCVMVLCSISTVIFNANPLMRFDGYYMLADWLEIPNLRDRSNRVLSNMFQEHCLGIEVQPEPYMEPWRLWMFIGYAVVAYVYRWVITFSILYFLANWLKPYKLGVVSGMLALMALGSMIGWPIYRMVRGYMRRGRMPDMKRGRVTATTLVFATLVGLFLFLPLPISRVYQTGLVLYDRDSMSKGKVAVTETAQLVSLQVRNGEYVYEGQLLAEFRSQPLMDKLIEAESLRDKYLVEALASEKQILQLLDPDERKQAESERVLALRRAAEQDALIRNIQAQLQNLRELRAPCSGIVMGAPKKEDIGKTWRRDNPVPFCMIGEPNHMLALVPVSPDDYRLLQQDLAAAGGKLQSTIYVRGRGQSYVHGTVTRLPESDAKDVPEQLTHKAGGPLAVKPGGDPRINVPQAQQYLIEVDFDEPDLNILPGAQVLVKIHCRWRSAGWWTWRKINTLFDLGLI